MKEYISVRNGVFWIENPVMPAENFADKWALYPKRRDAFFSWMQRARRENICIDGGMTKLMIYHDDHGWTYTPGK